MIGQTLSHFKITAKLGEGGMGEVYRAEDLHLHRDVAVKVLPDDFSSDEGRLQRFEREAHLLASLNHPHIAAIYGLEQEQGRHFLILELVEGETLRERLTRGSLPVEEALRVALQMAQGLEAAHEQGIVHRDLKPANIKITAEGTVKLLDFGLARANEVALSGVDLSQSPTMTTGMTETGMILGTAAYMSPQQASGQVVDKRTDIWAFGVVLHEMLTGTSLFAGESVTDLLAAVMRDDIEFGALQKRVPPQIHRLLRRCLDRDATSRLRDIGEARILIEGHTAGKDFEESPDPGRSNAEVSLWRRLLPWSVALLTGIAAWTIKPETPPTPLPILRFDMEMPGGQHLWTQGRNALSLSPDGRLLAFFSSTLDGADSVLYLRTLEESEARPIPGTEGGAQPFFSPDGRWVGYLSISEDLTTRIMKVSTTGGEPVEVCSLDRFEGSYGADWGSNGMIAFGNALGPVRQVPASGGNPIDLTTPPDDRITRHRLPHFLPNGKGVLYTALGEYSNWRRSRIELLDLRTGRVEVLIEEGSAPRYLPTGHIVFARQSDLIGVPFDLDRLEVTGPEVTVLTGVLHAIHANHPGTDTGAIQLTTSATGLLAYAPGSTDPENRGVPVIVDVKGQEQPLGVEPGEYFSSRVSADGRFILTSRNHPPQDIWIYDLERNLQRRQTFEGGHDSEFAIWGPEPGTFTFASRRVDPRAIYIKRVDSGPGELEELIPTDGPRGMRPSSWSPDGQNLVFTAVDTGDETNIWVSSRSGVVRPYLNTRFNEQFPDFSPDGRWLTYTSDESGQREVFVVGFPEPGNPIQVSRDGGSAPLWSSDGREIHFVRSGGLYTVALQPDGDRLRPSTPVFMMDFPYWHVFPNRSHDLLPDGRFIATRPQDEAAAEAYRDAVSATRIRLVQNWFAEINERVPTGPRVDREE